MNTLTNAIAPETQSHSHSHSHASVARFTVAEVRALYDLPLLPLIDRARAVHLAHHPANEIQLCTLLSEKTGLPVTVASDPLSAVANGTGIFLNNLNWVRAST